MNDHSPFSDSDALNLPAIGGPLCGDFCRNMYSLPVYRISTDGRSATTFIGRDGAMRHGHARPMGRIPRRVHVYARVRDVLVHAGIEGA